MTTTILRVKRRLDENPVDALVLHCKKAKLQNEEGPAHSVFVFSATVDDHENNLDFIKHALHKNKEKDVKRTKLKDGELLKNKIKQTKFDDEKKMKLINYTRGLYVNSETGENKLNASTEYALIDVHKDHSQNDSEKYAVDLYFPHDNTLNIMDIDDLEGIHPVNEDFFFGTYRDGDNNMVDSDIDADDDDSNDENNCRNEYPDTDDSIHEEDMINAVKTIDIDNELSTDDEDVYADNEYSKNSNGISSSDIDRYGLAYAKYKAKILKAPNDDMPELIETECPDSIDEDENEASFFYPKNDDSCSSNESHSESGRSSCSDVELDK